MSLIMDSKLNSAFVFPITYINVRQNICHYLKSYSTCVEIISSIQFRAQIIPQSIIDTFTRFVRTCA